jgi:GAF domain-containing protein
MRTSSNDSTPTPRGLAVGSLDADAYNTEEVSFLSLVASQVALAVDDALNFDAVQPV